jgi:hypothetical protein
MGGTTTHTPWLVVSVILAAMLLTGPLIGIADVTRGPGWADITVDSTPETVVTTPTGEDTMRISAAPAEVSINDVTGSPLVTYRVEIPELGISLMDVVTPSADDDQLTLALTNHTVSASRLEQQEYPATVRVTINSGDRQAVIHRKNVTMEVTE